MRRGVSMIAAGVTAFTLVISASVVYAYRAMAAPRPVEQAVAPPLPNSERAATSVAGSSSQVSPQGAAMLAGTFLARTDAYSVELSEWNGVPAYKVTFSSGDVAYVSLDGRLLGSVPANSYVAFSGGGRGGGAGGQRSREYGDDEREGEHEVEHEGQEADADD